MTTTWTKHRSPIRITFDPAAARAWITSDDNPENSIVEGFLDNDDWGTETDIDGEYADDLSNLLAVLPNNVLNWQRPATLQVDGVHDNYEWQARITVTLPNGITLAAGVEEIRDLLPTSRDYADGTVSDDDPYPQLPRLFHTIQKVVDTGNRLIDQLFGTLASVADGHAWYLRPGPDAGLRNHEIQSNVDKLRAAAAIVVGDVKPMFWLLPSHLWTPGMHKDEPTP